MRRPTRFGNGSVPPHCVGRHRCHVNVMAKTISRVPKMIGEDACFPVTWRLTLHPDLTDSIGLEMVFG